MRIFLRHGPSGMYFQGLGRWSPDRHKAFDFKQAERAIAYAKAWGLNAQVQLIPAYDESLKPPASPLESAKEQGFPA